MQELKAFNEKRAEIYWWLSSVFARELTQADIEQYHSPEIRAFLTGLGENPSLKPSAEKLVDALNRLQDREDAQLELAADFCDLFLKSDKDSALPYASMYVGESGLLNDEPAREMEAILDKHGIAIDQNLNEPADHIAIQLDFLGNLIIRSNELEQERHMEEAFVEQDTFITQHMLNWLTPFSEKCARLDEFGFYAAMVELTTAFLALDSHYLTGE